MNGPYALGLVKRGIDLVQKRVSKSNKETWRMLGPEISTREGFYRVKDIAAFGYANNYGPGEAITPSQKHALYDTEYDPLAFKMAWQNPFETELFDVYSEMGKLSSDVARSFRKTQNREMASTFNDGFTVTGYDGVYLFSASHPSDTGVAVQDNTLSATLGTSALQAAIIKLYSTLDANGLPMDFEGNVVLHVPFNLMALAWELTKTTAEKPGTANRDPNWSANYCSVDHQRHFTSTTGYMVKMADPEEHGLRMINFSGKMKSFHGMDPITQVDTISFLQIFRAIYLSWRGCVGKS